MANVVFKRGTSAQLETQPLLDGLLSVTTDDGRMHIDYKDGETIVRKTLYGGKLTFGSHVYDGTTDVTVDIYEGKYEGGE